MFRFIKNARVDSFIGAAEKIINSHLSRPRFYLILLNTNFFATLHIAGVYPPLIYAYVPELCLTYLEEILILPSQQVSV